jgi:hypothetical protein
MNFNCRSHREDALFVIALLVPAVFAGARHLESDRQMDQIAQARSQAAVVVFETHAPAPLLVARTETRGR